MHLSTIVLPVWCLALASAEAAPLKVCLVSGAARYKSDASLAAFKTYLETNYEATCTLVKAPDKTHLPGLEALDGCDVALVFARRLEIDGEPLERIKRYCQAGRPLVAVRTASHAFQRWLEFDKLVLGGNYQGHFKEGPTAKVTVVKAAKAHPVLDGVGALASRSSLYRTVPLASDCTLLMTGSTPASKGTQPVTWTRERNSGRVFYTSLGSPEDFANATFRRSLASALFWTARRDVQRKPLAALPPRPKPTGVLRLALQARLEAPKGSGEWKAIRIRKPLPVGEVGLLLCDVWDKHWCKSASRRLDAMIPRMNEVVSAARKKGILVIHAPSGTLGFYADTPARRRAQTAPKVTPPKPRTVPDPPLPVDASDGGCDDEPQCHQYQAWTRQHPGIEIAGVDAISDDGREVHNLLRQHGIKYLLVMGVHANMCVIGRSFGIKNMAKWGIHSVLIRDLTDTMYNPRMPPKVPHDEGTALVVAHIEKHWAPTVSSKELLETLR